MRIEYKKINYEKGDHFAILEKWHNTLYYKKFFNWNPVPEDLNSEVTLIQIREKYLRNKDDYTRYLIFLDQKPIGEFSYSLFSPHLLKNDRLTAYYSLFLIETFSEQTKLLSHILNFIHDYAKQAGIQLVEVNIFEYDYQRLNFYKSHRYREAGKILDWTYFRGKKWADMRLQYELTP